MKDSSWDAEARTLHAEEVSLAEGHLLLDRRKWRDFLVVMVSLASTTFGISALGLPGMLVKGGWALFVCLVGFSAYVNFYASNCMIYFADLHQLKDFSSFSKIVYGQRWGVLSNLLFAVYNAGIAVVSLVYLNGALADLSAKAGAVPLLCQPERLFWLAVCCFLAFPVLAKPRLSEITAITATTLLTMALLLLLLVRWDLMLGRDERTSLSALARGHPSQFTAVLFFSTYVFSYESNLIGIYGELPNRTPAKMRRLLTAHSIAFFVYYVVVGFAGAVLFDFDARLETTNLLALFPRRHSLVFVVSTLMAMSTFITFICAFKPCKETLLHQLMSQPDQERQALRADWVATAGMLSVLMLTAAALANSGVDFMGVIDVIALVFAPAVTLIGPILAYAREKRHPKPWLILLTLGGCLLFGLAMRAVTTLKEMKR